jgi:hypothetical protein
MLSAIEEVRINTQAMCYGEHGILSSSQHLVFYITSLSCPIITTEVPQISFRTQLMQNQQAI